MIRNPFLKKTVLSEKGIYHSYEFCSCCYNCLLMSSSLLSFSLVVFPEVKRIFPYRICHKPYNSSQMRASSFGDFILSFPSSCLLYNRVKPAETDELVGRGKSFNSSYFCHEIYDTIFPNPWNRSEDANLSFKNSFCILLHNFLYPSFLLLEITESFDLDSKDFLCERKNSCDRGLSQIENILHLFELSASSPFRGDYFREDILWDRLYELSGRELRDYREELFCEEIEISFELREEDGEESFDFGFSFSDELTDFFFFSDSGFEHFDLRRGRGEIFFCRRDKELTDSFSIFGIGLRRFRVEEAEEVEESVRVDEGDVIGFLSEEVEEVEVVDTGGFQTYEEGIFEMGDSFFKGEETGQRHREGRGEKEGGTRRDSHREGVLRGIDTAEIVNHFSTSNKGLEGDSLPLNLLDKVCPEGTINLYETGREENMLQNEPKSSGRMVFHPLPVSFLPNLAKNLNIIFLPRRFGNGESKRKRG